jgi:Zn-dependent protease
LNSENLSAAIVWIALFFLVAGPVHECAHAFTAMRLGDRTAKMFGRVTLDPVAHFDPVGGSLLAVTALLSAAGGSPVAFGWAKPTPVNPYNLRGRYADAMVAAAGPLSNLGLAILFAIGYRILDANGIYADNHSPIDMLQLVFRTGVVLNVVLMIFNLLPIAPLDGSHVLLDVVDPATAPQLRTFFDQYGLIVLLVVVLFAGRVISPIFVPIVNALLGAQVYMVG